MRAVILFVAVATSLAGTAPALAQSPGFQQQMQIQMRANELAAQQALADQRAVAMENQLSTLDARLRAEQAYDTVRAQSQTPRVPPPPPGALSHIDTSQLVSIPDDLLAASNARVKAAAENRR